jgi:hypothetical protein
MAQVPAAGVKVQVPFPLQVSLVHASPSSHVYAVPPQVPAVHTSLFVQASPSLHEVPSVFGLHAVWLKPGEHCWHWFAGLTVPAV